jgi:hypothetical protein
MEGDLFRIIQPFARVPWLEAILGTPIRATIQGGSMRTGAAVESWDEWQGRDVAIASPWLDVLLRLTGLLVVRCAGRIAVAPTLMRGPSDLAEAVLGPELMCLSMYDHPAKLQAFLEQVSRLFVDVLRAQLSVIEPVHGGYVNPFGIWAPGTVAGTQCDASAFLSADHYAQRYLPWDEAICQAFDYSIIHLHSCSLHTVDALLQVARPHAIQVTLETTPGAPTLREMLPLFERILRAKPLVIDGQLTKEQVRLVRDSLPEDGLCIIARDAAW